MNYLRQLFYEMRHHKMMTWVSISGTAVSIFLVLVFYMVGNLPKVETAPESRRHLIHGSSQIKVEITAGEKDGWSVSSGYSYDTAHRLFENLDGVETIAFIESYPHEFSVAVGETTPVSYTLKHVDANFWKMYDFTFIHGRPFKDEELLNTVHSPIVLTNTMAGKIFGTNDVIDRELSVNGHDYYVVGVVEDTNPILSNTFAQGYLPLSDDMRGSYTSEPEFAAAGSLKVLLLLKETTDPEAVDRQMRSRVATLNAELEKMYAKATVDKLESPMVMGTVRRWNVTKPVKELVKRQYLIYALLLLLPAINLSSMMRGRMQHRVSEIGVRRAFGARRRDIIFQLLGENFLVTLSGGLIGLVLSYLFMMFLSSSFISMVEGWTYKSLAIKMATPTFGMLFTWGAFAMAIGGCFVLNILTASLPAWRASSIEPAVAISKSRT